MQPEGHLLQHEELEGESTAHTQWGRGRGWGRGGVGAAGRGVLWSGGVSVHLRHLAVGISLPDELYVPAVAFLDDVVQPPQNGEQVEHDQEARVVVLAGPNLGELQFTNCALGRGGWGDGRGGRGEGRRGQDEGRGEWGEGRGGWGEGREGWGEGRV